MKNLIFVLASLFSLSLLGQTVYTEDQVVLNNDSTLILDKSNNLPITGVVKEYHFVKGLFRYKKGNIFYESVYEEGVLLSDTYYYENGNIEYQELYNNEGVLLSDTHYYENGNIEYQELYNNEYEAYYYNEYIYFPHEKNRNLFIIQSEFDKYGLYQDSETIYYLDSKLPFSGDLLLYNEDGSLYSKSLVENGKEREYPIITYYNNGAIHKEFLSLTERTIYYPNGNTKIKGATRFYESGQKEYQLIDHEITDRISVSKGGNSFDITRTVMRWYENGQLMMQKDLHFTVVMSEKCFNESGVNTTCPEGNGLIIFDWTRPSFTSTMTVQ
jgi:antitoxin component YwqK of YwqJK toxin-antitoxin module